jgi:hypothetical protein
VIDKPANLESLKARIKAEVYALIKLHFPEKRSPLDALFVPPRTANLSDPFEADFYRTLEQGGLEMVQLAADERTKREGHRTLSPGQAALRLQEGLLVLGESLVGHRDGVSGSTHERGPGRRPCYVAAARGTT